MDAQKKKLLITIGVGAIAVAATISIIVYLRRRRDIEATTKNMNTLLNRVQRKHPEVFEWWTTLPVASQRTIEDTMTDEIMTFLNRELSKNKLSPEVLVVLRKVGYTG
jgi:hypothetical protein